MTDYIFAPPEPASVAIDGESKRFPVRRIFCVGRNYAAHAREMGGDPDRDPPFFFCKPADAVVPVAPGSVKLLARLVTLIVWSRSKTPLIAGVLTPTIVSSTSGAATGAAWVTPTAAPPKN